MLMVFKKTTKTWELSMLTCYWRIVNLKTANFEKGVESHEISKISSKIFSTQGSQLSDIKVCIKNYLMLFISKMLWSTLLVILLSTIAMSKNPGSGFCGCPLETIHSFNEERIPIRITEWVCHQTGAPCGGANMSTVSNYLINAPLLINEFSFTVPSINRIVGCWIH